MSNELTVGELINRLNDFPSDTPVRVAYQPSWPLQATLSYDLALRSNRDGEQTVYLLAEDQVYNDPYAPAHIFEGQLEDPDEDDADDEDA